MKHYMILLVLLCVKGLSGQADTLLTYENFVQQIKTYHPSFRQADLLLETAAAQLKAARSSFDPVMEADLSGKEIKDDLYFLNREAGIKWQTASPVALSTGFTNNIGDRINPEFSTGFYTYLGVSVPLLKNLLTDEKRTALRIARSGQLLNQNENELQKNEIIFQATNAYAEWSNAYNILLLYRRYLNNSVDRRRLTRIAFENGDKSESDTIEVLTQYQNIAILEKMALMDYVTKSIELSYFLWNGIGEPYLLSDQYRPDNGFMNATSNDSVSNLLGPGALFLRSYDIKITMLNAERAYKSQARLPMLNLDSKFYTAGTSDVFNYGAYPLNNNYYVGLNFKFPLLNRKAEADLKLANIKIRDTELSRMQKQWELENKVMTFRNELERTNEQLQEQRKMRDNIRRLLDLELLRFNQGESSVFLLNSRENKLIETEVKLNEMLLKRKLVVNKLDWIANAYIR